MLHLDFRIKPIRFVEKNNRAVEKVDVIDDGHTLKVQSVHRVLYIENITITGALVKYIYE